LNEIKQIIKKLNDCRHLYYCIKFKKQFKYWLWELIRQPKIIQKYHPTYLMDYLDVEDLDVVLDNW
jgi:phage anti-repressor protein